jgi:hypothetical protein
MLWINILFDIFFNVSCPSPNYHIVCKIGFQFGLILLEFKIAILCNNYLKDHNICIRESNG